MGHDDGSVSVVVYPDNKLRAFPGDYRGITTDGAHDIRCLEVFEAQTYDLAWQKACQYIERATLDRLLDDDDEDS